MSCSHTPSSIHLLPHTPNLQTTPKQPDRQRISKSAHSSYIPTIFQVNVNATVPRPSKSTATLPKEARHPSCKDNTSSRTAQTPQKAAPMPQTSKSNANATSESPTIHKTLINATADHPPPKYLSMKMHQIVSLPPNTKIRPNPV